MTTAPRTTGLIELRLNNVGQLFNTMDPSPFHERDLDHDAEEFILSWARDHEKDSELRIKVVSASPRTPRRPGWSVNPSSTTSATGHGSRNVTSPSFSGKDAWLCSSASSSWAQPWY